MSRSDTKSTVGPITPREARAGAGAALPPEVFQVFNELIQKAYKDGYATVKQEEAAVRIAQVLGISRSEVFDRGLLDVEEAYRKKGWEVVYDSPAFNETYPATFSFQEKRRR